MKLLIHTGTRLKTIHSFGLVILEIEKMSNRDGGTYTCLAKNGAGNDSCSFDIEVTPTSSLQQAPKFTSQLQVY